MHGPSRVVRRGPSLHIVENWAPRVCGVADFVGNLVQRCGQDDHVLHAYAGGRVSASVHYGGRFFFVSAVNLWRRHQFAAINLHLSYTPRSGFRFLMSTILTLAFLGPIEVTCHQFPDPRVTETEPGKVGHLRRFIDPFVGAVFAVLLRRAARVYAADEWVVLRWPARVRAKTTIVDIPSNIPSRRSNDTGHPVTEELAVWLSRQQTVVGYFGLAFREKGTKHVFDLCLQDPRWSLLYIGPLEFDTPYRRELQPLSQTLAAQGRLFHTGPVSADMVGCLIDRCDAVVLPYEYGLQPKHGSAKAVWAQGTLLVTTSVTRSGYDAFTNTCYVPPGNLKAISEAVGQFVGRKAEPHDPELDWSSLLEAMGYPMGA